jgi:hypothetical protein
LLLLVVGVLSSGQAQAAPNFPAQTGSGSIGLEGTISTAAPKQAATISTPSNGATFSTLPVTVTGLCPTGLLVKIFSNNVFVGSVNCDKGSYSIQIDLFGGQNQLVARVYDALDQAGPDSNTVTVTYNDPQFTGVVNQLFLTSLFAERGAPPGSELSWPIILSGGSAPYAISVDWGDGSPPDLISQSFAGTFTIKHTYKSAGIFKVIVKATDAKGNTALLQLTAVATGAISKTDKADATGGSITKVIIIWWPVLLMLPLIVASYWLGRRSELYTLRKTLEKNRREDKQA